MWEQSSLLKINGEDEKHDFKLVIGGEVLTKNVTCWQHLPISHSFLVVGVWSPHQITFSFASDQKSHCKDVEKGWGVLKLIFCHLCILLSTTMMICITWCWLLLYNNLMEAAHSKCGEAEFTTMYNTVETTAAKSGYVDSNKKWWMSRMPKIEVTLIWGLEMNSPIRDGQLFTIMKVHQTEGFNDVM